MIESENILYSIFHMKINSIIFIYWCRKKNGNQARVTSEVEIPGL